MNNILSLLEKLKLKGCSGVKVSFEDEGALLNEIITMRNLTSKLKLELSIKIGGPEAKRDIVDCIDILPDSIVAPMIESDFGLKKFIESIKQYNIKNKIGFNLETISAYNNLNEIKEYFPSIDFVTFGRVDFVGSLKKNRDYIDSEEIFEKVSNVFSIAKKYNIKCYLGGSISKNSKNFIKSLMDTNLLDKFETRYIIFDTNKINIDEFEEILILANEFEIEWLKFIRDRYLLLANKDIERIKMIENRMEKNKL